MFIQEQRFLTAKIYLSSLELLHPLNVLLLHFCDNASPKRLDDKSDLRLTDNSDLLGRDHAWFDVFMNYENLKRI